MVAEKMTMADLATRLTEVLDRVRGGEEFAIERDDEAIATIVPQGGKPGITLRELAAEPARLPPLDDDFGTDIEAAGAIFLSDKKSEWRVE